MPETGARTDPFFAFRFEIKLDGEVSGGFSECSGLQLETEVQDYAEGGLNTHLHKFPTRTKQSNITLKRGIVDSRLWDWYYNMTQGQIEFRNGSIAVYSASNDEMVMEWQFQLAFPSKWQGPDLNASQSNVAVETLEITHQGLERQI